MASGDFYQEYTSGDYMYVDSGNSAGGHNHFIQIEEPQQPEPQAHIHGQLNGWTYTDNNSDDVKKITQILEMMLGLIAKRDNFANYELAKKINEINDILSTINPTQYWYTPGITEPEQPSKEEKEKLPEDLFEI
jgi:hypothetical protein